MYKHRLRKSISVIKHPVESCLLEGSENSTYQKQTRVHEKSGHGQIVQNRSRGLYEPVPIYNVSYTYNI